jgi:hypothetical protein
MPRRFLASVALAAAAVLAMSSTAFAHECFIANRSAQGNANATHSGRWATLVLADFVNSPGFPPGVDPDCFLAYWSSHGGPDSFTVRIDKTIGEGSQNPNLGNGSGLDHIEDAYGALAGAAFGACAL